MTEQDAVSQWFARPRFGLFIHFGLYAIDGWHEQDQMRRRIPRAEYAGLALRFNPTEFDADRILDTAEAAGMEYVCLTTKHHDGFCLWDTKQTDFNVMHTPCKRDLVGELAEACHRRAFPLGLYYSVVDWHHPNYPNRGRHHEIAGPEPGDRPDWHAYLAYLRAQVRELCTNYGELRHFFWDMNVPEHQDRSINAMIRSLHPRCVINDRGFDEGDFGTPERDYDPQAASRHSHFERPTEACNSVGAQSWGYREDEDYYNSAYLIRGISTMMAKGANYLLNVGPDATGRVPHQAQAILAEIGAWYGRVREAFTDAQPASDLTQNRDVFLTRRGDTLYVHALAPLTADAVMLPPLSDPPCSVTLLNTGQTLACSTQVVPVHWKTGKRFLRITRIPREAMATGQTLVFRLTFKSGLPDAPDH